MSPVYFFNQRFNGEVGVDAAGLDLPDLEAARLRAIELAREIMSDEALRGEVVLDRSIEVTDAAGQVLIALPFADVASLRLPRASRRRDRAPPTRPRAGGRPKYPRKLP